MNQFIKGLTILTILIESTNALICYACNSNWQACGKSPDLSLIRYNKEVCRGPCRLWKNKETIFRDCSNRFIPNNATYFLDKNGLLYKYCYSDLCNTNYDEIDFTSSESPSQSMTSIIPPAITPNTDLKNDTIFCYFCNERWKSCAYPPDIEEIKFSLIECNGVCVTWSNPFDGNRLYRGCLKKSNLQNSNIFIDKNGLVYSVCSTNMCNFGSLITNSSPSLTTVTTPQVETTKFESSTSTIINTTTSNYSVQTLSLDYEDEELLKNEDCSVEEIINEEDVKLDYDEFSEITIDLEINSTHALLNSTQAPTLSSYKALNSSIKSISCYFCNARWTACGNPPNLDEIKHNTIECTGVCVSWYNPWDRNLLYRGCSTQLINGTSGIYFDKNGLIYNYCSTNLCNIDGGISTISIETTRVTSTTTTKKHRVNNKSFMVSFQQFKNSITNNDYPEPTYDKYYNFVNLLESHGGITTKREAAMFLAQILWESDGLRATSEYACKKTGCPGVYGTSRYIGQSYYGRGYIQLSWHYNYEAASRAIYGDDRLLKDPNQVATNDEIAWATAFWFWRTNVGTRQEVKQGYFGSSTMAINGGLECNGPHKDKASKRFQIYKIVLKEFNFLEKPIENGCYN